MKNKILLLFTFTTIGSQIPTMAQTFSSSYTLEALPKTDCIVPFNIQDEGTSLPIIWGLDTAWPSEENIRRGIAYLGPERIDIVRASFQPTYPIENGELTKYQTDSIDMRLDLIDLTGSDTKLVLNCDHPHVDDWYVGHPDRWAQLIELTMERYQKAGREIVTISPFNEPDFGWGQGTINDFYNIAELLQQNPKFDNIRICGGNTLNCDKALEWYNFLKDQLDEGNTHQLAGTFDNYAKFFQTVRENGHHATADELHNVMEAMVGVEYGMQTGIWWGTTEHARAEFVKASDGQRLAYTENRPNWTAASVYRNPDGEIKGFVGSSERQAATTTYRFVSEAGDVFFNGYGPQREFIVEVPGGTGYNEGQSNAEGVVDITTGDDVPEPINGEYVLLNKSTRKVMEIDGESNFSAGTNIKVNNYSFSKKYQKWNVQPVANNLGGDFSYYSIVSSYNGLSPDILNWSLEDGGNIIAYTHAGGNNQQWFLEYAGDGWYYIRSRHSALCLESAAGNVQQGVKSGKDNQLWRFVDKDVRNIRIKTLETPGNLSAEARPASILLKWDAQSDATSYTILRSEQAGGPYNVIGRHITDTAFIDNKAEAGKTYYYVIRSLDDLQNKSANSDEVSASVTNTHDLILNYTFEGNLQDQSINAMNAVSYYQTPSWTNDRKEGQAIALDDENFIQLPTTCANNKELTISTWMYWNGGSEWQRIFDFGCDENRYMFLTPKSDKRTLRFAIKNKGEEEYIETVSDSKILRKWTHLAITISQDKITLYVNGEEAASSSSINIRPTDFMPFMNYIGRSQFNADPSFDGYIDDFSIYNYELSPEEVKALYNGETVNIKDAMQDNQIYTVGTLPADKELIVNWNLNDQKATASIYNMQGTNLLNAQLAYGQNNFNVSTWPEGVYILNIKHEKQNETVKFTVKH